VAVTDSSRGSHGQFAWQWRTVRVAVTDSSCGSHGQFVWQSRTVHSNFIYATNLYY